MYDKKPLEEGLHLGTLHSSGFFYGGNLIIIQGNCGVFDCIFFFILLYNLLR